MPTEVLDKVKSGKGESSRMNGRPTGGAHGLSGGGGSSGDIHNSRKARRKSKRTYTAWMLDKGAKLVVWYTLFTVVFRCPSTPQQLTDTSPRLCTAYLQIRDCVTPYAQPYYDQYLSAHVQRVQPYVDRFNEHVSKPGIAAYHQHAAPRLSEAQKLGRERWETTLKPTFELARQQAGKQFEASIAPRVRMVHDLVQPYYESVSTSAGDMWALEMEPVYRNAAPYAHKLYHQAQRFAIDVVLPQAEYAGAAGWKFWVRNVWPRMRVLYGENVEPQLVRITERLGRYKDGKKLEAEVKNIETSSSLARAPISAGSVVSSLFSDGASAAASQSSAVNNPTSAAPDSGRANTSPIEQFEDDLKSWEQICAKAVEEGAEHLNDRISELSEHQRYSQADGTGHALITQLENTAESAINSVKAHVLSVVAELPNEASDGQVEEANEVLVGGIRSAGQGVKNSAQAVREWRRNYNSEINDLVDKALLSTLETIDGIRELRLTEIGRKYADKGLPHKVWAKYNDFKKATHAWRDDVERVATGNSDLAKAKSAGEDIESRAMHIAASAAQELGRLKDVARWKVAAGDTTNDFETRYIPAVAERARQQVAGMVSGVSDALVGTSDAAQGIVESATSAAAGMASSASETAVGSSTGSLKEAASTLSEAAFGIQSELSNRGDDPAANSTDAGKSVAPRVASAMSARKSRIESAKSSASAAAASHRSALAFSGPITGNTDIPETASATTDTVARSETSEGVAESETLVKEDFSSSGEQQTTESTAKSIAPRVASAMSARKSRIESAKSSASLASASISSARAHSGPITGVPDIPETASASSSSAKDTTSDVAEAGVEPGTSIEEEIVFSTARQMTEDTGRSVAPRVASALSSRKSRIESAKSSASSVSASLSSARAHSGPLTGAPEIPQTELVTSESTAHAAAQSPQIDVESEPPASDQSSHLNSQPADERVRESTEKSLAPRVSSAMSVRKSRIDSAKSSASSVSASLSSARAQNDQDTSLLNDDIPNTMSVASASSDDIPDILEETFAGQKTNKKVFGGAMAQVLVEAREPIIDDIVDSEGAFSESIQSIVNGAGERASELTRAVAEAIRGAAFEASGATSTQGTGQGVSSVAREQYESAIAAASSVLFETQGATGSGISVARQQYLSAVTAASHAIYGTPPVAAVMFSASEAIDSFASHLSDGVNNAAEGASSRYSEAVSRASEHYEAAKSRVSLQISGTPEPLHQQMFHSVESAYSDSLLAASQRLRAVLDAAPSVDPFSATTMGVRESIASIASSRLAEGLSLASVQYQNAKIAIGAEPTPAHQAYLATAQAAYYQGVGMAHDKYSSFMTQASSAIGAMPAITNQAYLAGAQSTYSAALAAASSRMNDLLDSAASAVGATTRSPADSVLHSISKQYDAAVALASTQLAAASSRASVAFHGTSENSYDQASQAAADAYSGVSSRASQVIHGAESPWTEVLGSQAAENWDALVSRASESIYGAPSPLTDVAFSQAGSYAAQVTQAAVQQYETVQSLFQELLSGREPDFTQSVMARLQSVYSMGAPAVVSSASSYAGEVYGSASSAVASIFTPPATLDTLIDQVNEQLNVAVDAASVQIYGSSKSLLESATEAAASAYSDAASQVSEAVYGTQIGYAEAAQASVSMIGSSASKAISDAVFGTQTPPIVAAGNSAASVYSSLTSAAAEQVIALSSAASSAVYGEEQSYIDEMQSQIAAAIASAQSRIQEFGDSASRGAADTMRQASQMVVEAASSASSAATAQTQRIKDEL